MILSDREIKAALARGVIGLTPVPADRAWSSTAVDLRLAREIILWKNPSGSGAQLSIAPAHAGFNLQGLLKNFSDQMTIPPEGYLCRPNTFLLGWTIE